MRRAQVIIESALAPENINSTSSAKMELEYYKKDGTTFWSEDTFVLIRGEDEILSASWEAAMRLPKRKRPRMP